MLAILATFGLTLSLGACSFDGSTVTDASTTSASQDADAARKAQEAADAKAKEEAEQKAKVAAADAAKTAEERAAKEAENQLPEAESVVKVDSCDAEVRTNADGSTTVVYDGHAQTLPPVEGEPKDEAEAGEKKGA